MNITVGRDAFADAVTRVIRALDRKPALPVLAGLLLEASDGVLTVTGAGSGQAGRLSIDATQNRPGAVLVDAQLLARIARHLPIERAKLKASRDHLVISCGAATWRLLLMPDDDYPPWVTGLIEAHNEAELASPRGPDGWENELSAPERRRQRGAALWTPPGKTRTPFEAKPFEIGDWVTVTTDDETLIGQMAASDLVVWIRGDQTVIDRVVVAKLSSTEQEWYVERSITQDGETRRRTWPLRRTMPPSEQDAGLDTASALAPDHAESAEAASVPVYRSLPEVFEVQWPDLDYPPVPS